MCVHPTCQVEMGAVYFAILIDPHGFENCEMFLSCCKFFSVEIHQLVAMCLYCTVSNV